MNPRVLIPSAVLALVVPVTMHMEGTVLESYRDPIGIWTRCVGHTGPEVGPGQRMTQDQCRAELAADLKKHNAGMVACLGSNVVIPASAHAAALDFTINVGVGNFCSSSLARRMKAGDWPGYCTEYERWTMVGKMDCRLPQYRSKCGGILRRRSIERALCEGKPISLGASG